MQGLLSDTDNIMAINDAMGGENADIGIAVNAVRMADALLAALEPDND